MRDTWTSIALAAGLGAVSGLRTFSALATASWTLSRHARSHQGSAVSSVRSAKIRVPLTVLAVGEMALDKTPFVSKRTDPPSLFGRAVFGALCGVLVADYLRTEKLGPAAVGAASAVASTFVAYHVRKAAGERTSVPDWVVAVVEDTAALCTASGLARRLWN